MPRLRWVLDVVDDTGRGWLLAVVLGLVLGFLLGGAAVVGAYVVGHRG